MKELIKVSVTDGKQAVSARDLHAFLESKREFATWIKDRIKKYGLVENQDYQVFDEFVKNPSGGRPMTEYALSIDCAKELAMVEGNSQGKKARQYFIECEKALKTQTAHALPQSFSEALMLAAQQAEQIELQKSQLQLSAPKVEYYDEVLQSTSAIATNVIAKELGTSAVTLNEKLVKHKVIYKQNGTYLLHHKYTGKGYEVYKTYRYVNQRGELETARHLYWTEKGREFIHGFDWIKPKK